MEPSPSPDDRSADDRSADDRSADDRSADEEFMRRSLSLARRGEGCVEPNPMVGCTIVRNGVQIGQGFHRRFGDHHAEVEALRSLDSAEAAKGATAYVTLEPCCHQGKTPPCSQALIKAGIARVVVAMPDPFPQVAGGGLDQLRAAGIQVSTGILQREAEELCAPYLKRVRSGIPWVIAKWAMTIDGKIATTTGQSQWITGAGARRHVHLTRGRVDAILTGMGTVAADNPKLTARLEDQRPPRIATRVVCCRHSAPAVDSQLVQSIDEAPLMILAGPKLDQSRLAALESAGATCVVLDTDDPIALIKRGLQQLGSMDMTNVLVEGGGKLAGSLFSAGQVDECHVYVGPKAFGGAAAPGPIGGPGIAQMSAAWQGRLTSLNQIDDDFLAIYQKI